MVETNKNQLVDMTLKNRDLLKTDYSQSLPPERLISIISSPDITDFELKCDCALQLLKICNQKLQHEETLLRIFVSLEETLKRITKDNRLE